MKFKYTALNIIHILCVLNFIDSKLLSTVYFSCQSLNYLKFVCKSFSYYGIFMYCLLWSKKCGSLILIIALQIFLAPFKLHRRHLQEHEGTGTPTFWTGGTVPPLFRTQLKNLLSTAAICGD